MLDPDTPYDLRNQPQIGHYRGVGMPFKEGKKLGGYSIEGVKTSKDMKPPKKI